MFIKLLSLLVLVVVVTAKPGSVDQTGAVNQAVGIGANAQDGSNIGGALGQNGENTQNASEGGPADVIQNANVGQNLNGNINAGKDSDVFILGQQDGQNTQNVNQGKKPGSSPLEGNGCDADVLWWARNDVFKTSITDQIKSKLQACKSDIGSWMNPTPCPYSCNEVICLFSCAFRSYNFISDSGVINKPGATSWVQNYVLPYSSAQSQVPAVAEQCIETAREKADAATDANKFSCNSIAYYFLECVYLAFDDSAGNGNVNVNQQGVVNQNQNTNINAGQGSSVASGTIQNGGNNQNVTITNPGTGESNVNQNAEINQNSNTNINAGKDSDVTVLTVQNAENNQDKIVNNPAPGTNDNQNSKIDQSTNVNVNTGQGSSVGILVGQSSQNNASG